MTDRITTPHETQNEPQIRPQLLDDFIGQNGLKNNLKIFIESARKRNATIDHVLFHGPPGLGKTTLAQIVASEMGVGFRGTAGPILTKAGDLAAILSSMQAGDVLFIDEIHRLSTAVEEILYSAMEDFTLDIIIGEGATARTVRIDLPQFTLVGATTRIGLLSSPMRDRFGIPLRLQFYDTDELMLVISRAGKIFDMPIIEDGSREIAMRSRGTPRIALRLLKRVRDFAIVSNREAIDKEIANIALNHLEVDEKGLDSADHRYLLYIINNYSGGPVGVDTICAGISEQRDTIEETIEPYLMQLGMVQRTPRGRVISPIAYEHLGIIRVRAGQDNLL